MITDHELTERAAKAAGYRCCHQLSDGGWYVRDDLRQTGFDWNPRENGNDSFNLAAKLKIDLVWFEIDGEVRALTHVWNNFRAEARESIGNDASSAARLVILRVAAEVGRKMA